MRKKEFSSFDVAAVVRELRGTVLDSRVNNVYQLDGKTLLFKLHEVDKPALRLILEAGRRMHLTAYALEKPSVPPAFCMALRKHLRNGWLTDIEQYEFERVVVFSFKVKTGKLQLVLEIFGDGNIILIGEKGEILQALVYKRMRDRNILRGEALSFAPSAGRNPLRILREEMRDGLKSLGEVEIVRALARFLSIGGIYAEEVLLKTGIDKTRQCSALAEGEFNTLFDGLQDMLSQVAKGVLEPCIVADAAGGFVDVAPFRLKQYESGGFRFQPYDSFNEASDEFYARIVVAEKAMKGIGADQLKREAERLKRIIADQEKVLVEAEKQAARYRLIGDTIYANTGDLQALLDKLLYGKRSGKEWNSIVSEITAEKKAGLTPSMFVESFDSKALVVNVRIGDLAFGLGLNRTLFDNAAEFYEWGKRAKQKLAGAKTALEESQRKLAAVDAKIQEAETLEQAKPSQATEELAKLKVRQKEWFEKFRWFVSSDRFLVVGGKDAVTNEVLVKKYAEEGDLVFHADIVGAPFVVVKAKNKKPSENCLHEAAEFAAAFSRGWQEGFGSTDVYWVKPEQLSKGGPSGEYVPHGAFVVSGQRNRLRNIPLKLAIGLMTEDSAGVVGFIGGPVEAVKAKAAAYIVITPGDMTGKELFKQILRALGSKVPKELREKVFKASIEEIREFVPFGKADILAS